jgi:hypothetical protein
MRIILLTISFILFLSNFSFAKVIDFSCKGFKSVDSSFNVTYGFIDLLHLTVDTNKDIMIDHGDGPFASAIWKITKKTERYFYSDVHDDSKGSKNNFGNRVDATLNRYTGEYNSKLYLNSKRYFYHCIVLTSSSKF